jgi:hypothetical protein
MAKKDVTANKSKLRLAAGTVSGRIHVIPTMKGWSVKREGASRASAIFGTKKAALQKARQLKRNSLVVLHRKDGTVEKAFA